MAKKIKKKVSNVNRNDKNTGGRKNRKMKLTEKNESEHKPTIIKDRKLKFKSKDKENKVIKAIKQIEKNKQDHTVVNNKILNPNITKVVNVKNKSKNKSKSKNFDRVHAKRTKSQVLATKKQQPFNKKENKQQKKHYKKNKMSEQLQNKMLDRPKEQINIKRAMKNKKSKQTERQIKEKNMQKINDKAVKLNTVLEKKIRKQDSKSSNLLKTKNKNSEVVTNHNLNIKKLEKLLANKQSETKKEKIIQKPQSLRQRMMSKLKASRFRYLNETLYNSESSESKKYFKNDPDSFKAYHDGYKQQVEHWPINPLDIIIASVKKMPNDNIIADFGCGEARLAASVPHKVHSFDFVSLNKHVTVCDVAHTPLLMNSVHVVIFCLSLMGTNLKDYLIEANRVLKKDGVLKIAEVESRFEQVEDFIKAITSYGFKNTWKDLTHNLFYFLDFKKETHINGKKNKLPAITLKPCLYKKR